MISLINLIILAKCQEKTKPTNQPNKKQLERSSGQIEIIIIIIQQIFPTLKSVLSKSDVDHFKHTLNIHSNILLHV